LHTDLDVTRSYGVQLSNAIWQEIEGDTLAAAYAGAGSSLDAGNFGGTAGQGVTASVSNIADIPVLAMESFLGKKVVFNNNKRFGKLPYEDYDGMLTWIIPPQVWTVIQKYMVARNTDIGDRATVNGYKGEFGNFQVFVANTLPFTTRLALSVSPTDGDTITIKGVTLTFKVSVPSSLTSASNGFAVSGVSAGKQVVQPIDMEQPYSNRELDGKFDAVHQKLDVIVAQTTTTNGKVRKIIMALILLFGIAIGLGFEYARIVLPIVLIAV
jgi:hypothetical protein